MLPWVWPSEFRGYGRIRGVKGKSYLSFPKRAKCSIQQSFLKPILVLSQTTCYTRITENTTLVIILDLATIGGEV